MYTSGPRATLSRAQARVGCLTSTTDDCWGQECQQLTWRSIETSGCARPICVTPSTGGAAIACCCTACTCARTCCHTPAATAQHSTAGGHKGQQRGRGGSSGSPSRRSLADRLAEVESMCRVAACCTQRTTRATCAVIVPITCVYTLPSQCAVQWWGPCSASNQNQPLSTQGTPCLPC